MNAAHLHLILNHLPVLGEIGGVTLLAAGLTKRSKATVRLALLALVASGVLAVPVFFSGRSAAEMVGRVDGVVQEAIAPHEDAATAFLGGAIAAGVLAAITLATSQRWILPFALLASLIASLLGLRAAILGGQIHHPELLQHARSDQPERSTAERRELIRWCRTFNMRVPISRRDG